MFYKNVSFNLVGVAVPFLIAIPAMGFIAREIGFEAFGLFTLALTISGVASILDLGTTKALVREIALNVECHKAVKKIFYTSFFFVALISIIFSVFGIFLQDFFIEWLNIEEIPKYDLQISIILIFSAIPFTVLSILCLAYFEGVEDFLLMNKLKIFNGVLMAILPLLFVFYANNLIGVILGILISRIISLVLNLFFVIKKIGFMMDFEKNIIYSLFRFGGWLTVSNFISVLMQYSDRFLISNLSGAKNIAAYTAPSEIISRITIIPIAVLKVAFPSMISAKGNNDVYRKTYQLLIVFGALTLFFGFLCSEWFMRIWLGDALDIRSVIILKILLVGVFFNILAQAPYLKIQSKGYSNITAYIHIVEVVPYFLLLFKLMELYGLTGVAWAWSIRMLIDYLVLSAVSLMGFLEKDKY